MTSNQVAYHNLVQNERLKSRELDIKEKDVESQIQTRKAQAAGSVMVGIGHMVKGVFSPFS